MTTSLTLASWLATLRDRGLTLSVDAGRVAIFDGTGAPWRHPIDVAWVDRYHDALVVAAAGTHPEWWAGVAAGEPVPEAITPDLGCAVAGCDGELEHYTPDAVPYCADHDPAWWLPSLPAVAQEAS